ncbi:MAG TPA: NAD(P)-binding protein [Isosphaeraceae bacterium]
MVEPTRRKIAILGGGTGALAAAFGLTERPGWQDDSEITVYQLGWRLGGKGASGRNAAKNQRIEEHGLHVWSGFYDNAFRVLRACYDELHRAPGAPLATLDEAFLPQSLVSFTEFIDGAWKRWDVEFPTNPEPVGSGGELPTTWDYVTMLVGWMARIYHDSRHSATDPATEPRSILPGWVARFLQRGEDVVLAAAGIAVAESLPEAVESEAPSAAAAAVPVGALLDQAHALARSVPSDPTSHPAAVHHGLLWLLDEFHAHLTARLGAVLERDDDARRLWLYVDFSIALIRGLIRDGVLFHGFDALDDRDWDAWLRANGAAPATLDSPQVRGMYDYIFAFEGGDTARPSVAAGTMTRCLLRLALTYKTAIFMKMRAGMGDTIFAPLYLALRQRGVKFAFFRRVKSLHLAPDGTSIAAIRMGRQATLAGADYDPLVDVGGLPCWPSTPRFDQLVEGDEQRRLFAGTIDGAGGLESACNPLESAWSAWRDVEELTLEAGRDFDAVVLGIALGALPGCCAELIAAAPAWRAMVENVKTVPTLAMQLWMRPTSAELGSDAPRILTGYAQPFDTWCDMTHLLGLEQWPAGSVGNLSYFCGPMKDPEVIPPETDTGFPARELGRVEQEATAFLEQYATTLWTNVAAPPGSGRFDWSLLDAPDGDGAARFDAQYWRANVNPSDRYVISLPGTTAHRLRAGESGFVNLVLAGDWVRNGLNYGCVESAVMGGLQAARALGGYPRVIVGEEG